MLTLFCAGTSWGKTIAITCADDFAGGDAKMHVVYDGDARGMLHVTASVGDFTVPATLYTADDDSGVTTMRGSATVAIKAPPFATMEACEAKRAQPSTFSRGILHILPGDSCLDGLKIATTMVPFQADLAVVLLPSDPPGGAAAVDLDAMRFRYPDKSATLGAVLEIGLLPPPECTLDKP